jgi:hypothetical protein
MGTVINVVKANGAFNMLVGDEEDPRREFVQAYAAVAITVPYRSGFSGFEIRGTGAHKQRAELSQ